MTRTTVNLDDDLLREARKRARERGTTLSHVIEEALREALTGRPETARYEFDPVMVRGSRPPAVEIDQRAALYDFMEGPG